LWKSVALSSFSVKPGGGAATVALAEVTGIFAGKRSSTEELTVAGSATGFADALADVAEPSTHETATGDARASKEARTHMDDFLAARQSGMART
jgi:hypothetical protein